MPDSWIGGSPQGSPAERLTGLSVVALGGGHGLFVSLAAWRRVVTDLTAVVTVADNGGSSGRLRHEFGVLPPGDLRMALAALCGDDEWGTTWAQVVQHRFAGEGEMNGHALGNLLIVGLWELLGDHVQALDLVGRLLGAEGRVLPMSTSPMDITAQVESAEGDRSRVRGQVAVATTAGRICSIELDPVDVQACPEAVAAVRQADWVVLGPGSWYTSVIPHLVVPQLRESLCTTRGRIVVVLNLEPQQGETHGFRPEDHLAALIEHAPALRIHTVVADRSSVRNRADLEAAAAALGAALLVEDIARGDGTPRHDAERLSAVFRSMVEASEQGSDEFGR